MSINRDMKKYMLQKNIPEKSQSGFQKPQLKNVRKIDVAVYKKNDLKVINSEKYIESTHTGLTYCKTISAGDCRIVRDEEVYEITDCNTGGRMTNLLLKKVSVYA